MKSITVVVNGKQIKLDDTNYLAQGGQGVVYAKNNAVFKIYHDTAKLIPEDKIKELQVMSDLKNVIIPSQSIYDAKTNNRIGFCMRYVDNTEYLCKLFVANFKQTNNVSPQMIVDLVKVMQQTMIDIHKRGIVVGDYNEMNFLTDSTFKIPYHIDVDSYQTPSYKCNAIMESVRDRKYPLGDFNEYSDWFSWAVVAFQLYTGIHPYKGKHPQYKMNELPKRMDDGISIFDKDVSVPKFVNMCGIPKSHLDWFKGVFIRGDRSIPPFGDGVINYSVIKNIVVDDKSDIISELINTFNSDIIDLVYNNGMIVVLTRNGIYCDGKSKITFANETNNGKIIFTPFGELLFAIQIGDELHIFDETKTMIDKIKLNGNKFKIFNDAVYVVSEAGLVQYVFERIGKMKMIPSVVAPLNYQSAKIYDGVVIQDIFGKYSAIVPCFFNKCITVNLKELDGKRILHAKRLNKWIFVVYEEKGKTVLASFLFNDQFTSYECRIDPDIDFRNINAVIKDNGMIVMSKNDDSIELFFDFKRGSKMLNDTSVSNGHRLYCGKDIYFVNGTELYTIRMKK